jgi:hypothetical protein
MANDEICREHSPTIIDDGSTFRWEIGQINLASLGLRCVAFGNVARLGLKSSSQDIILRGCSAVGPLKNYILIYKRNP